ncbi:MAG: hypothetical protein WDN27_01690 [Candidatus Saccharibacteria bacterium]
MGQPDPTPDPAPNPAPGLEPASPAATAVPSPEAASWQFRTEDAPSPSLAPLPENLSWSAAEFIEHQKSPTWYALLILAGAAAAALDYFATKDKISTGIILFAAITFGVFAAPQATDAGLQRESQRSADRGEIVRVPGLQDVFHRRGGRHREHRLHAA